MDETHNGEVKEGEEHLEPCWKCEGKGREVCTYKTVKEVRSLRNLIRTGRYIKQEEIEEEEIIWCSACRGTGKLDWVSNTLRKDIDLSFGTSGASGWAGSNSYGVRGASGISGISGPHPHHSVYGNATHIVGSSGCYYPNCGNSCVPSFSPILDNSSD